MVIYKIKWTFYYLNLLIDLNIEARRCKIFHFFRNFVFFYNIIHQKQCIFEKKILLMLFNYILSATSQDKDLLPTSCSLLRNTQLAVPVWAVVECG
jgi:hypothetical protein